MKTTRSLSLLAICSMTAVLPACGSDSGVDGNVVNGTDGTSCSVTDDGDGTKILSCADGTVVTISDGTVGSGCTVGDNGDGTKTISCADGTSVTVVDVAGAALGTGGSVAGTGGRVAGTGGATDTGTIISTWDAGYASHLGSDFAVFGPVYTYEWHGATCTLIPAEGQMVTDSDNITVSNCAGGDYAGGGFAFAFCAAPGDTWDELVAAIPGMATWAAESKHTWAECNPGVNLVDVTIPGLPACAAIEFQDASDTVVTDKNSAVSVSVKVDGVKGCSVENLDLSYAFVTD